MTGKPSLAPDTGAPHLLAARHLVFGTTNLLVLSLPAGWHIRSGIGAPEIDARTFHAGRAWATTCAAHYVLWGAATTAEQAPPRLELDVRLVPGARGQPEPAPALFTETGKLGETEFGGHAARFAYGTVRHGLFGRERRSALWVCAYCEETERWLTLTFRAPLRRTASSADHLAAVFARLAEARCH